MKEPKGELGASGELEGLAQGHCPSKCPTLPSGAERHAPSSQCQYKPKTALSKVVRQAQMLPL